MSGHPLFGQILRRSVAFFAATTVMCAQQATTSIPAPTIRVTTHMVVVDVVVTDKQGKAITGLHADDFVVEENGKAQKIASLTTPENTPAGPELPPGVY